MNNVKIEVPVLDQQLIATRARVGPRLGTMKHYSPIEEFWNFQFEANRELLGSRKDPRLWEYESIVSVQQNCGMLTISLPLNRSLAVAGLVGVYSIDELRGGFNLWFLKRKLSG